MDDLNDRIDEYIASMPSLPTSIGKILQICNDPTTSPADLNQVISLDPVLVGRVMKLVNSAYYGLDQHQTSLVRAIVLLGINTVKNMALSSAIMCNLPTDGKFHGLDLDGFWRHSLCVGVAAKLIADHRGIDSQMLEEYFTAGLLHDIGKIPINAVLSKEYMLTVGAADYGRIPLYRAEDKTLGMNHSAIGEVVANAWSLGGPVGDAIVYHHRPAEYSGDHGDILYSVVAANHFASSMEIGFSGNRYPEKIGKLIMDYLQIDEDTLIGIEETVHDEIEKAQVFMKI